MKRLVCLILIAGLVLAACGSAEPTGPPEINYGRDICIECGMIIGDARFAAAYRTEDGTEKRFDDLGGLLVHGRETGELESAQVWVSDFDNEELIDAVPAFYVPTLGVVSPMGHGILAFAEEARAVAAAQELGGEVLPWAEVKELPVIDGQVGHHHDGDG